MKNFFKCLLTAFSALLIAFAAMSLTDSISNIIYSILCLGKVTQYQAAMYGRIAWSAAMLSQIGLSVWLSFLFAKAELVSFEKQGFTRNGKPVFSLLAGIACGLLVDLFATGFLLSGKIELVKNTISPRISIFIILGLLEYIGVGFWEETLFRGIIQGYCEEKGKRVLGVILSTLSFVLIHFLTGVYSELNEAVFLFAMSILYSAIKLCRGNIWMSIGCHAIYDWAVTYLVELRLLHSKECFFSLIGLITKWRRTAGLAFACAVVLVIVLAVHFIGRFLQNKTNRAG